jgi:hypothetical protein
VLRIQVTEVVLAFLGLSQQQIVFERIGVDRQVVAVGNNARPP